jgi:hypothetical protein
MNLFKIVDYSWKIYRSIECQISNTVFTFTGILTFKKIGSGWEYFENGITKTNEHQFKSHRRYFYYIKNNRTIDVYYKNQNFFHEISIKAKNNLFVAQVIHQCREDSYRGDYQFHQNYWLLDWKVTGLQKNYLSQTKYTIS